METEKNLNETKSENFLNVVTFKELQEKSVFLKIAAEEFKAGDFLNTYLRFFDF